MDPDSSVFQKPGHSLNGTVTSQPLQTSAVLCNVLSLCTLFSLSWQTSLLPISSFCVNMSLLLMLVSSLSLHCSSFGSTHAIFHPTATFSNCPEVSWTQMLTSILAQHSPFVLLCKSLHVQHLGIIAYLHKASVCIHRSHMY